MLEAAPPLLDELLTVRELPATGTLAAAASVFEVHHATGRLVGDSMARLPDLQAEIDVLVVGRRITVVEAADRFEDVATDEHACRRAEVDIPRVAVLLGIRVVATPISQACPIAPDDRAGFLERSVKPDEPSAHRAAVRLGVQEMRQAR
jgi:hypothetical protein